MKYSRQLLIIHILLGNFMIPHYFCRFEMACTKAESKLPKRRYIYKELYSIFCDEPKERNLKKNIYMYNSHFALQQKLIQQCKSNIFQ